jgi:cell division protein FtsI/penicillin-binding protein 2
VENRKHALRFSLVFFVLIASLLFFSVRLIWIQVFWADHLASLANKQHRHLIELEPVRGSIYDRRMRPLAFNVPAYSLFANPKAMTASDKQQAVRKLSEMLSLDPSVIQENLRKDRYFVWIKRKLPLELAETIKHLGIRGLAFRKESRRSYPAAHLAAHVIGFAGIDNEGLEGMELFYNKELKGKPGYMRILRDAHQRELMIGDAFVPPHDGLHLVLTIDETIQYIAEQALENAYRKYQAQSASIIVMDTRTGEILALANRPTYNLENYAAASPVSRTNRVTSYVYEPGSVFKVVTAVAALEEGRFSEKDKIFCENGRYKIANNILTDHHPHGMLTFKEIFGFSSNIGVAKIAQQLGADIIYKYGRRLRFGIKTGMDLQGEVSGWLKAPSLWSKTTIGAIPIGYEVTVTSLQLVCMMTAIANKGVYLRPFVVKCIQNSEGQIIKSFEPQMIDHVVSEETARRVTEILKGVVEEGTGQQARIKGVEVAGKTGTARKVIDGSYSQGKYYATFAGFAPADNPRVAVIVVVDEPHSSYFGGTVAAPVFKEVVENTLKYLES